MSKRPIAILLISAWFLQVLSPAFFYAMGKWAIQTNHFYLTNLESQQKNKETLHFSSVGEIEWEEEGRELMLNNELYDVISITHTSKGVDVLCWADKKESNLTQLEAQQKEQDQGSHSFLKQVFKNKIVVDETTTLQKPEVRKLNYNCYHQATVIEPVAHIFVPPPRA